jgi:site-specific recombinase XerD
MLTFLRTLLHRTATPALPSHPVITFADLTQRFLGSREKMGVRWATLRNYEIFARSIIRERGAQDIRVFSGEEFVGAVAAHGTAWCEYLKVMMRWAHKQHLVPTDPTGGALRDCTLTDATPPVYLTPSEAQRFFACITEPYRAAFTLAMYAGVRPYEVCRLDWRAINVRERRIRIDSAVSKIRRTRIIEDIPTIVWAQLALHEQREGPIIPACAIGPRAGEVNCWAWAKERRDAGRQARVTLAHDILRHSFATYFVALTGEPGRAAKVLGHYDLRMLVQHYDGVATKQDAEDYFHPKPILALPVRSATP